MEQEFQYTLEEAVDSEVDSRLALVERRLIVMEFQYALEEAAYTEVESRLMDEEAE